ncbi:MAG: glycosyltransferase, partial [Verrucomicrobiota bacterium]
MSEEKTICLNMIVKNESAVIERCLRSLIPIIDYWVICDTGSSDDTRERVRKALKGIPGELHERPWIDFAHNRNEVLERSRGKADYLLFIDADMEAHFHEPFKHRLTMDAYNIRYEGPIDYAQRMLV